MKNMEDLFKNKFILAAAVISIALGLVALWWFLVRLPPESSTTFTGEYDLVLKDYDGKEIGLSDFKRTLLVVHTWASWCPYCGEELQNLQQLKERYGDDVTVLAVNRAEPEAEAKAFTAAWGIDTSKVEVLLDEDDEFYKSIEGYAMPETVFINTRGSIIHHQRGPMRLEEVTEKIDALIAE